MDSSTIECENMSMEPRCVMYVFSGTGNTMLVAEEYRKIFGDKTEIYEITSSFNELPLPDDYDTVGIGYPVHAFNAPLIVRRFASSLHAGRPMKLFLFHTGGEGLALNDSSSFSIREVLGREFHIISERHYVMPYNMIFRHSDEMVKHMITYMRRLVPIHAESIKAGQSEKMPLMPFRHMISVLFRIEWLYAKLQGPHMHAETTCTSCGLCERNCPMGNIQMENGHPVFGRNCALCVRCSFNCPVNAISIGILNGWKVNGRYQIDRIMNDDSTPSKIPIEKLSILYRNYYKNVTK